MRLPPMPPAATRRRPPATALLLGAWLAVPASLAAPDAMGEEAAQVAPKAPAAEAGKEPAKDNKEVSAVRVAPGHDAILADAAELHATRGTGWSEDGVQWLLLEGGDVAFRLGAYGFCANRALVKVVTEKKPSGPVRHLTLYLEDARELADGSVSAQAPRLVVCGATTGAVRVAAGLLAKAKAAPADAPGDDFIARAHRRLTQDEAPAADAAPPAAVPAPRPQKAGTRTPRDLRGERRRELEADRLAAMKEPDAVSRRKRAEQALEGGGPRLPALPGGGGGKDMATGPFHFSADRVEFVRGKDGQESSLLLMGHVRLSWEVGTELVEVQAENAVVFGAGDGKDKADGISDASQVAGIYLEDNVVVTSGIPDPEFPEGRSTLRAPRAYFDVPRRRATLLDAVMYAADTQTKVPLYLRARLLRANAQDSFEVHGATLANNGFAEPSFSLGARRLTLSVMPADPAKPSAKERALATASGVTPEVEGVPLLWLPYAAVPGWRIPLRSAYAGYGTNDGATVRTKWGVYELLDLERPKDEDLTADLDWRGRHGGALGGEYKYDREESFGRTRGYFMPDDKGVDRIAGRDNILHDGDSRHFLRFDHRQYLTEETEVTLHAAKESDPAFRESFFQDYTERPPETGLSLKHAHEDWAVSGTGSFQLNDFTPALTDLQSRGFQTERTEADFRRIATELFGGRANWYSENRAGRVRAAVGRDAPAARGIADWASLPEFGIASGTSFRSAAQVAGVPTSWVNRVDTRQELAVPLQSGPVDVTPYAVARYTQWSDGIAQPGGAEDSRRFFGGGGVRFATELAGAAANWNSAWLDVNGLRHILRPELDLGWYGSSTASGTLPMYDPDVEGLGEGAFLRMGLVNTLQTRRGGEANHRTVDWLRFKQDVVLRRGEEDPHRAVPRFVDWRPEYALGGSHTHSELLWQASNALAVNAEATYAFDSRRVEQWSTAADYIHTDRLMSRLGYLETAMYETKLASYGIHYRLTSKYDLAVTQTMDLGPAQTGWLTAALDRKIPGGILRFVGTYDELNGAYSVGVAFSPQGLDSGQGIGQSLYRRNPQ